MWSTTSINDWFIGYLDWIEAVCYYGMLVLLLFFVDNRCIAAHNSEICEDRDQM